MILFAFEEYSRFKDNNYTEDEMKSILKQLINNKSLDVKDKILIFNFIKEIYQKQKVANIDSVYDMIQCCIFFE